MPSLVELAPSVWQLPLLPRSGVNAYLVGDVLVDAGPPSARRRLLATLAGRLAVQAWMLGFSWPIQFVTAGNAVAIVVLASLPAVRERFVAAGYEERRATRRTA